MDECKKMVEYLLVWYPSHARDLPWRKDKNPYHVWLSEIMLQQTRVEAVKGYYKRFLEELPSIQALADVEENRLLKLWEGLGYYNRARNLKKAAITIVEDRKGEFPDTYEGIVSLAGIGEYTAGAIGSICFDLPTPAVDGNVLRVYTRVMEDSSNIDKQSTKKKIREQLAEVYPKGQCGMLTQALMELGATVCLPNGAPKCEACPLGGICLSRKHNTWQQYPVRDEKKSRRLEDKTVFVLQCGDRIAVRKRGSKGLLSGMWEFPNVEGILVEQQAADVAAQWQTAPEQMKMNYNYTHVFSHVEWRMTGYYLACRRMCKQFQWVTMEELEHEVAMPSAFRPFLDTLKEER
ncbi:MAG: A/G-specific adenine glycosylase [Bacteroides sp.]|nr:A/G-specific adenine glycosylase [Bacteroides sp.]MCM1550469.1 A/G-specific adenine glycosylase [Clostridium sp.]